MMLVSVKICFRGQINCQQNAENKLKSMPLFGAASQVGVPTMRRLLKIKQFNDMLRSNKKDSKISPDAFDTHI